MLSEVAKPRDVCLPRRPIPIGISSPILVGLNRTGGDNPDAHRVYVGLSLHVQNYIYIYIPRNC